MVHTATLASGCALLLLIGLGSSPLAAVTLAVTDCGDSGAPGQLRTLINAAAPGDTLRLPACTVTLTGAALDDGNLSGDLDLTKSLTIQGLGPGLTVIDGGGIDRVFDINPTGLAGVNVTLAGMAIRNARPTGIRNAGTLTLADVSISDNVAEFPTMGGGILNDGTLTGVDVTIRHNGAHAGGGLANGTSGVATLTNSTISGNGGSINVVGSSGGILNRGSLTLANVTVSGNTAREVGGIDNRGTLMLTNVTISGNTADTMLGGKGGLSNSGSATLVNSILANPPVAGFLSNRDCAGPITSLGHNVESGDTCGFTAPGDLRNTNPLLAPLGANGGPTETQALLPGSPATDAGDPAACPATDQRGVARPLPARCAMGAFEPVPMFLGGVHVAAGDVDGSPGAEIVTGADAGGGPHVRGWKMTAGTAPVELFGFFAYAPAFTGGVRVAVGDVDGDGMADIVTGAGPGGGPHVRVFSGAALPALVELAGFFAYNPAFTGGVFVAAGDVNGDGQADIITGADAGGGPHVRVFDGAALPALVELAGFFAYVPAFTGGVRVAACDVNGDGKADILTGAGPGGGPHVRVFSGADPAVELASFFAYTPAFTGGVFVACGNLGGAKIVTGADAGGGPHVRAFTGTGADAGVGFFATAPTFTAGVRVAVAELEGFPPGLIVTAPGSGSHPYVRRFTPTGFPLDAGFFAY